MSELNQKTVRKSKKRKYQNLHSLKMFNFNQEWKHQLRINQDKEENFLIIKKDKNGLKKNKVQQRNKNKDHIQNALNQHQNEYSGHKMYEQVQGLQQIYPKKKAFSQLQSYRKLELSNLQARFSKPTQIINDQNRVFEHHQKQNQSIKRQQLLNQLGISFKKLVGLKLPQIKVATNRQNRIIKKFKMQNLKIVNVHDRIKTMKFSPEKENDQSFESQQTTQILKNKLKNLAKLKTVNDHFAQSHQQSRQVNHQHQNKIVQQDQRNLISTSNNHRQFQVRKIKEKFKEMIQIKKNNKTLIQSSVLNSSQQMKNISNLRVLQSKVKLKSKDNQQQQEIIQSKNNFPILQVYDKKMKIGRKKKSEEDKIRAMLIKTLEKTKGKDYVAQAGTSQKPTSSYNSSLSPHKKSLSKNSKQSNQKQQQKLILINNGHEEQSMGLNTKRKFSFKRGQIEKMKKVLNDDGRNLSQPRSGGSMQLKNKRFVEMVREVEGKKKSWEQKQGRELQQIKQEKTLTLSKQQQMQENEQYKQEKNKGVGMEPGKHVKRQNKTKKEEPKNKSRKHKQEQRLKEGRQRNQNKKNNKIKSSIKVSQQNSQNQFIPSARQQQLLYQHQK